MNTQIKNSTYRIQPFFLILIMVIAISLTGCTKDNEFSTPLSESQPTSIEKADAVNGEDEADDPFAIGFTHNEANQPISGLLIEVYDANTSTLVTSTTTDASGYFNFSVPSAGTYEVSFSAPGFEVQIFQFPLNSGTTTNMGTITMIAR